MKGLVTFVVGAIGLGSHVSARADESGRTPVSLQLIAPRECGDLATLQSAVALRATKAVFDLSGNNHVTSFEVAIRKQGLWFVGTINGEVIQDRACAPVVDAAALLIALAIDPFAATRPQVTVQIEAISQSEQTKRELALAPQPANPSVGVANVSARAWHHSSDGAGRRLFALQGIVGLGATTGTTPHTRLLPHVGLRIVPGKLFAEATLAYTQDELSLPTSDRPDASLRFNWLASRLSVCYQWTFALCAGSDIGRLQVAGQDVQNALASNRLWLAMRAEAKYERRLWGETVVSGQAWFALPTIRDRYGFSGQTREYETSRLTFGVGLGALFDLL